MANYPADSLLDQGSFCNGVQAAQSNSEWCLYFATDQRFWSSCEIESYERFGVRLVFTGDIVSSEQESFNAGYNAFVWHQMNETHPGMKDSLGVLPQGMRLFDADLMRQFKSFFSIEIKSDSLVVLRLDLQRVRSSYFETLDGVTIQEVRNKQVYSMKELELGVQFSISAHHDIVLRPNFTEYIHPEKICLTDTITIPISLN